MDTWSVWCHSKREEGRHSAGGLYLCLYILSLKKSQTIKRPGKQDWIMYFEYGGEICEVMPFLYFCIWNISELEPKFSKDK